MIKNIVRWILVVPVSLLGFALALLAGLAVKSALDSFCPTEWRFSGMCIWQPRWIGDLLIMFGAGLAAFLIVILAALMAPFKKVCVAWSIYGVGALWTIVTTCRTIQFVTVFGGATTSPQFSTIVSLILPPIAALSFGLFAVILVNRRHRAAITKQ